MILLTFNILNNRGDFKKKHFLDDAEILKITVDHTSAILRILENHDIKATFFVAVQLVDKTLTLIKKIVGKGHEISLYNDGSTLPQIENAKRTVEDLIGKTVRGIRQKEIRVPIEKLKELGFSYISNIERSSMFFPLKRLKTNTEISLEQGLHVIPEGISPYTQIPYNEYIFQLLPLKIYEQMISETLENNDFVIIYLHTSQFTDPDKFGFDIPLHRRYNSGKKMDDKLSEFLRWVNKKEFSCTRIKDYFV